MGESDVRQRHVRAQRAGGPASDLVASKLRPPLTRPGTVRHSSLSNVWSGATPARSSRWPRRPVMARRRCCPSGPSCSGQPVAWVSVDEADNDPKVLLTYVAAALDAVEPIGERVFDALASPASSVPGSVVPRLALSVFVDDLAGGAGPGRRAPAAQLRVPGRAVGAGPSRACRARGWRWPAEPSRRCGSGGCAPRARSRRSARPT